VVNTTSGQCPINGRTTSNNLYKIKAFDKILNGTEDLVEVPGVPDNITSGALFGEAHMSTSFIEILRVPKKNNSMDSIYIPDGILRVTYLYGTCAFDNTLVYGFTSNKDAELADIDFKVLFAKNLSQSNGDYVDIPLPKIYNKMYLVIVLLVQGQWANRSIVGTNKCSMNSTHAGNMFCVKPSLSTLDPGDSHFVVIQGYNSLRGIKSNLVLAMEDDRLSQCDKDYNDFVIGLSSKYISTSKINDTLLS